MLAEARSWERTPYHHRQRRKGVGVDCAMLLYEVYHAVGLVPELEIPPYPPDWHMHRSAERYLGVMEPFVAWIDEPPLPADVVVFQIGRCYAHGVIVVDWPVGIHAVRSQNVQLTDFGKDTWYCRRPRKVAAFEVEA